MQKTADLFNGEGPSKSMQAAYAKFDGVMVFLDECYQNRATYEMDEEENNLTDQQMFFLMEEIASLVGQVLKNKNA